MAPSILFILNKPATFNLARQNVSTEKFIDMETKRFLLLETGL
jgi:hypothetical protein